LPRNDRKKKDPRTRTSKALKDSAKKAAEAIKEKAAERRKRTFS
jgi:hypothetical protein